MAGHEFPFGQVAQPGPGAGQAGPDGAHGYAERLRRLRHGVREVTVEVTTDGSGSRAASPAGSGRGLDGLGERVGALGGEFSAGPHTGGGFLVRARIPAGSPS